MKAISPTRAARLGRLCREARERVTLSQGELAERLGVSQPYLSRFESGSVTVESVTFFLELGQAIGIDGARLLRIGHPEYREWERALAAKGAL